MIVADSRVGNAHRFDRDRTRQIQAVFKQSSRRYFAMLTIDILTDRDRSTSILHNHYWFRGQCPPYI